MSVLPFMPFGAQYYRAPTPLREDWARDMQQFKEHGFNTLKFWAQWRWNNPREGAFVFDDLDELMDLAAKSGLKVIINVLFDCAPAWLFRKDYDVRMLTADGRRLGPWASPSRQTGGAPGPCLNHPEARQYRLAFLAATVARYADHPALLVWDTWNEPELNGSVMRTPRIEDMLCHCEHCRRAFIQWLLDRHGSLDAINRRWARNYQRIDELELPVCPGAYLDFIDFRQFQTHVITDEQRLRYEIAKEHDRVHPVMCHTVPMPLLNPVTCCADEWALTPWSDWVGNTAGCVPESADILFSSGKGRPAICSEIHALPGVGLMRPKPLDMAECKRYVFTPLAHGIKGFVFWQYRPERLGAESPAWGLTRPDGSPTPWLEHVAKLNRVLQEDENFYLNAQPTGPEVGLLYDPANHVLAWCAQGSFEIHDAAVFGAYRALFEANFRVRFVRPEDLSGENGSLSNLRTIVFPFPYALERATAEGLRQWVADGGGLIGEAFFADFDLGSGLHSVITPGHGLSEVFGAVEEIGMPYHAAIHVPPQAQDVAPESLGPKMRTTKDLPGLATGHAAHGYLTRTPLAPSTAQALAAFDDGAPAIAVNAFGAGKAVLCGTLLTAAASRDDAARRLLQALVVSLDDRSRPAFHGDGTVRIDLLQRGDEIALAIHNLRDVPARGRVTVPGMSATAPLCEVESGRSLAPSSEGEGWELALDGRAVEMFRPT